MPPPITYPETAVRSERRIQVRRLPELAGIAAVLVLAAALNLVRLSREGYANQYYAAAVKSMLTSWHNFFFVSFDAGGFVTVDKPPLGFWIQAASAKLFGFHGWSILLPEAVAGVLSVGLLYYLVRRAWGPVAGLLAALGMAVTPVAVAVNRNNTIDSLLVLTLLLATWATLRATESGKLRTLLLGMALVGLGFNIKMMQAYLALPALALVYLAGAPGSLLKRVRDLALGGVVVAVVSFSWIAVVELTPASDRPYIGSSQNNSALELALGYNGVQRLLGQNRGTPSAASRPADGSTDAGAATDDGVRAPDGTAGVDGGTTATNGSTDATAPTAGAPRTDGGGGMFNNGAVGPFRLFTEQLGGQASWTLALAIVGAVAGLWVVGMRNRHDPRWQSTVLWSLWLLPAAAFFSVAEFFHSYYLVMLAPPVAALAATGLVALWRAGGAGGWRADLLPIALVVAGTTQVYLLRPYPSWSHWLSPFVAGLALSAAAVLVVARLRRTRSRQPTIRRAAAVLILGAVFLAPAVWSIETVRAGGGSLPAGGPAVARGFGGPPAGIADDGARQASGVGDGALPADSAAGRVDGQPPVTAGDGAVAPPDGAGALPPGADGAPVGGDDAGARIAGPGIRTMDAAMLDYLEANRNGATFLVATSSANEAAPIILQTGQAVMAMGGFTGSDPILTTDTLARLIQEGTVRYFLIGGFGGPGGSSSLTSWIRTHGTAIPASAWGGSATTGSQLYEITSTSATG